MIGWLGLPVGVSGVERVGGDGCVGDGEDAEGVGIEDGVLEREGGLGSALPETGEEHQEEAWPERSRNRGQTRGWASMCMAMRAVRTTAAAPRRVRKRKERQARPKLWRRVRKAGPRVRRTRRSGLPLRAEVLAELDGVDLDEIEVEAEDGGHEEDEDDAGRGGARKEWRPTKRVVDVGGPEDSAGRRGRRG